MNKEPSNISVEAQLEILSAIQKATPPPALYESTMAKITDLKKSYISMKWMRAAAAVFVFIFCAELIIFTTDTADTSQNLSQQEELASILPPSNYTLYND